MAASAAPLLIKRYASRRLYNTETSDYVTLEDIAAFIRDGREVKIVDLKSGDDLTRQYLLQIIAEHEGRGENVLPVDVLTDLVRSYTTSAQSVVPQFLAASFEMLRESQSKLMENMATMPHPMSGMPGFEALQRQQQMFLKALMGGWRGGSSGPEPEDLADEADPGKTASDTPRRPRGKPAAGEAPTEPDSPEDMAEIRRQLAELQSRISKL
ncbi:polyhydroxyalkanoate synthesis repressor PhaR [Paracoccus siganidrum]|uniref:Polyhydroxyalkanoate synthesis repressor PhaR n=1 Tax=Paracoccus siganidrum TaxID=1276757 RepID=A0A419ACG6_9RHOB|nr:polyhydroxyalkanoate synthesis repressor PhaR [Paracoccus siganidrum]RJL22208.1 polyhydroxyalkanoate synthesis repressor PhaR [Paracoccus siganidrum]RMC26076.1 polyhydroxyalkanoate synthesis repressor PhaR [Paracoccus siganidrum]